MQNKTETQERNRRGQHLLCPVSVILLVYPLAPFFFLTCSVLRSFLDPCHRTLESACFPGPFLNEEVSFLTVTLMRQTAENGLLNVVPFFSVSGADASYEDPLGPLEQRPRTAARRRDDTADDEFDNEELGDDMLPE